MSTAAHELKTPLTTIYAYAQLAQKSTNTKNSIKSDWIDTIISNCVRLQNLIQDLFSMSQMSAGLFEYSMRDVHLGKLLTKIVNDTALISKRTIQFENSLQSSTDTVDADASKLELAFQNIIGNAIKYSSHDTPVRISLHKKGDHLTVCIIDTGKGIEKKDLKHVFEKFFRGKQNGVSGIGLGMFLCKEIIQAHHGDISIKSKVHVGTTVFVRLPVRLEI